MAGASYGCQIHLPQRRSHGGGVCLAAADLYSRGRSSLMWIFLRLASGTEGLVCEAALIAHVDFSEARDLFVIIFGFQGLNEKSWTAG
jgi:hypothetical protein